MHREQTHTAGGDDSPRPFFVGSSLLFGGRLFFYKERSPTGQRGRRGAGSALTGAATAAKSDHIFSLLRRRMPRSAAEGVAEQSRKALRRLDSLEINKVFTSFISPMIKPVFTKGGYFVKL